jgi:hypothetical protein
VVYLNETSVRASVLSTWANITTNVEKSILNLATTLSCINIENNSMKTKVI